MYVVMNRIPVKEQYRDEFEQRFRERAGLVDQSPGFIRNLILRPAEGSGDYHVVMTLWESRKAFEAWTQSDAFAEAHRRAREHPREQFAGPSKLELFEVVCDSGDRA